MQHTIRELQQHDLPALIGLCTSTLPYDHFSLELLQRRIFGDPDYHQPYQLAAWAGDELIGVAIGVRRRIETGQVGGLLLLAVSPAMQRQGIASALLDTLEQRMQADQINEIGVGGTTPNFFWAGIDMRYTPAYCLFLARGYEMTAVRVNQIVDLTARTWQTEQEEAQLASEGITVSRATHAERAALADYLLQEWGPWWQAEGLNGLDNTPITTFVARQHGQYCGFASYNSEGFDGHFGPTGTNQSLRGKGLGRILFYRCMQDIASRGLSTAEVVWVGPISFYTRVAGATVHRAFWAMQKKFQAEHIPQ